MNYTATPELTGGRRRLPVGDRILGVLREDVRYTMPVPVRGFGRSLAPTPAPAPIFDVDVDAEVDGCLREGIDGRASLLAAGLGGTELEAEPNRLGPIPPEVERILEAAFFPRSRPSLLLRTIPIVLGVLGVDFDELIIDEDDD